MAKDLHIRVRKPFCAEALLRGLRQVSSRPALGGFDKLAENLKCQLVIIRLPDGLSLCRKIKTHECSAEEDT